MIGIENASNHLDLYSNIPRKFLERGRRKRLEVDDLDDLFQNEGFKGVYKARTGEARDGCAVFWKDNLFSLLHQEDIGFQRFGLRNNVAQLCALEVNNDNPESDICKLTTEERSTRNKRFIIGNIHVLFNPNRGDIKLDLLLLELS